MCPDQALKHTHFLLISCWLGSNFLCATHIIPVKNEEGVVIMFILNFDYILEEGSSDSLERLNQTSPSKADQCEYKEQLTLALSPCINYHSQRVHLRNDSRVPLQLPCAAVLYRMSLPHGSVGMLTQAFSRRWYVSLPSSQRSGPIRTVSLPEWPDELLEQLWRALPFLKLSV